MDVQSSRSILTTRIMVVLLWHFVWDAALTVGAVAASPMLLGLMPKMVGYGLIVISMCLAALAVGGYLGMGLVLKGDCSQRAWVTPAVMNVVYVVAASLQVREWGVFWLAIMSAVFVSLGMWARLQRRTGKPATRSQLFAASAPLLVLVVTGAVLMALGAQYLVMRTDAAAPTIKPGDVVVSVAPRGGIGRGDVVVAADPRDPERSLIRRVDATGGEDGTPVGMIRLAASPQSGEIDSDEFGPQPATSVHGRVVVVIWPPSRVQALTR